MYAIVLPLSEPSRLAAAAGSDASSVAAGALDATSALAEAAVEASSVVELPQALSTSVRAVTVQTASTDFCVMRCMSYSFA
jgi:hypothetical protein